MSSSSRRNVLIRGLAAVGAALVALVPEVRAATARRRRNEPWFTAHPTEQVKLEGAERTAALQRLIERPDVRGLLHLPADAHPDAQLTAVADPQQSFAARNLMPDGQWMISHGVQLKDGRVMAAYISEADPAKSEILVYAPAGRDSLTLNAAVRNGATIDLAATDGIPGLCCELNRADFGLCCGSCFFVCATPGVPLCVPCVVAYCVACYIRHCNRWC